MPSDPVRFLREWMGRQRDPVGAVIPIALPLNCRPSEPESDCFFLGWRKKFRVVGVAVFHTGVQALARFFSKK